MQRYISMSIILLSVREKYISKISCAIVITSLFPKFCSRRTEAQGPWPLAANIYIKTHHKLQGNKGGPLRILPRLSRFVVSFFSHHPPATSRTTLGILFSHPINILRRTCLWWVRYHTPPSLHHNHTFFFLKKLKTISLSLYLYLQHYNENCSPQNFKTDSSLRKTKKILVLLLLLLSALSS